MSYLQKPLSVRQSQHIMKFVVIVYDLELISESTFADAANAFDEYVWEVSSLSWEGPPKEWRDL